MKTPSSPLTRHLQNDDTLPLPCYWIQSSHNTYLPGSQALDITSTCYFNLQLNVYGGGCMEIDLIKRTDDNDKNDFKVSHDLPNVNVSQGHERLSIVFQAVKESIERGKLGHLGPIILTIDNKNKKLQSTDYDLFNTILEAQLGQYLYIDSTSIYDVPLSQLKGKVILRWCVKGSFQPKSKEGKCVTDETKMPIKMHMTGLDIERHIFIEKDDIVTHKSRSIEPSDKVLKGQRPLIVLMNTLRNTIRVFPHFLVDGKWTSRNYDNWSYLAAGMQLVAINAQMLDKAWFVNRALFQPNGKPVSYRMKPLWLLGLAEHPPLYTVAVKLTEDTDISLSMVAADGKKVTITRLESKDAVVLNPSLPILFFKANKNNIYYRGAVEVDVFSASSTVTVQLYRIAGMTRATGRTNEDMYTIAKNENNKQSSATCGDQKSDLNSQSTITVKLNVTAQQSDKSDMQAFEGVDTYNAIVKKCMNGKKIDLDKIIKSPAELIRHQVNILTEYVEQIKKQQADLISQLKNSNNELQIELQKMKTPTSMFNFRTAKKFLGVDKISTLTTQIKEAKSKLVVIELKENNELSTYNDELSTYNDELDKEDASEYDKFLELEESVQRKIQLENDDSDIDNVSDYTIQNRKPAPSNDEKPTVAAVVTPNDMKFDQLKLCKEQYLELQHRIKPSEQCSHLEEVLKDCNGYIAVNRKEYDQLRAQIEELKLQLSSKPAVVEQSFDPNNCLEMVKEVKKIVENVEAMNKKLVLLKQTLDKTPDESTSKAEFSEAFTNITDKFIEFLNKLKQDLSDDFENAVERTVTELTRLVQVETTLQAMLNKKGKIPKKVEVTELCQVLNDILAGWDNAEFLDLNNDIINMVEDFSGSVRVYIKIKPLFGNDEKKNNADLKALNGQLKTLGKPPVDGKSITVNGKNVAVKCTYIVPAKDINSKPVVVDNDRKFGPFFGVYTDAFNNFDTYTGTVKSEPKADDKLLISSQLEIDPNSPHQGLHSVFKQVQDGYSIVLFGYGLSGSGKTYSLLGSDDTPGILHYGLANLEGVDTISVKNMFEHYFDDVSYIMNILNMRGKIHNLVGTVNYKDSGLRSHSNYYKDEQVEFEKYMNEQVKPLKVKDPKTDVDMTNITVDALSLLTSIVTNYRIDKKRIKATPNNPQSSRSHLFIVFEITFNNKKKGYVTIVDTAGRESPIDIHGMFFDTTKLSLQSLMITPPNKNHKDFTSKQIVDEGFFINESINHLIYFFNLKNGSYNTKEKEFKFSQKNQKSVDKYDSAKYYIDPTSENQRITTGNNKDRNCLMIPILNYLGTLSDKPTKTKYIMMCMMRQDIRYCSQIFETLEFADKVKSS